MSSPGRRDYEKYNYCTLCGDKYPKDILRCNYPCSQKLRTKAHNKGASARYRQRKLLESGL